MVTILKNINICEIGILNQLKLITVDGFKRALNKLIYYIIILQYISMFTIISFITFTKY